MALTDLHFDVKDDYFYKEGKEEGEARATLAIAQQMLKSGESAEKIMSFTGLTREQVDSLKK